MPHWFPSSDYGMAANGFTLSVRARIAEQIIHHCALVTGTVEGEDSAGRAKVIQMSSRDVAVRANDIADALVTEWEARGWIREVARTLADDALEAGQLDRIKASEAYKTVKEELMGRQAKGE